MKKIICLLVSCLMLTVMAAAEENWYLKTAVDTASRLEILVGDEVYLKMMTSQSFDSIAKLKEADFSAPSCAYRYTSFDENSLGNMLYILSGGKLSDVASEIVSARFPQTLLSMHTGTLGTEFVAVSTMLTYSYTDQMPEGFEPCVVLLSYGDAAASVSFSKTGPDTITIQAQPYFYDSNLCADEAAASFNPAGMPEFSLIPERLL